MKRRARPRPLFFILAAVLAWASCKEEEGKGTLSVEIWGEKLIEEGIPADEFSDGWSVTFDKFIVTVGDIAVARGEDPPDFSQKEFKIYDLVRPGPVQIAIQEVPAGRYNNASYSIAPADDATQIGNAALEDLNLMKEDRYSIYVKGRARKNGEEKTFAWGFNTATNYHKCESKAEVPAGGAGVVEITIHGDHLFCDDLFSEELNLTFDTLAEADADGDGEITQQELASFDIRGLPNYQVGSADVDNLWDFISYLTRRVGHIDGEGHCHTD